VRPIITLTTDFGEGSAYVAQMKGAILTLCRDVELIDISHSICPQTVRDGAIVLVDATPRFPPGTIHVAVIDPGVGTSRRIIYAEIGRQRYIAPDNGLLSMLAAREAPQRIIALENREYWSSQPSHTFHGRDIMAPVAAHLATGLDPEKLGSRCDGIVELPRITVDRSADSLTGTVIYVDSFGNLITNLTRADVLTLGSAESLTVDCGGLAIRGIVPTYGAAMSNEVIALFDSQGRLEIAKVGGNVSLDLGFNRGEKVVVRSRD
jgi:S-adenosylmethionine hydrolase